MSNRQWLKALAASETKTWMNAVAPLGLDGKHRLETRRSVYVFEDAVCIDIARRDEDSSSDASMIGMRVVGWLIDVEGQRRLVARWVPGARAVLWRAPAAGKTTNIAVTSPSFGFVQCSLPGLESDDDYDDLTTAEYTPLPKAPAATGSFARLFP